MQPEPYAWNALRTHAAAQLPPDFPDRVLRAARLSAQEPSPTAAFFRHPFTISALTAAACLTIAVIIHASNTRSTNEQHLAEWQEITQQTASLDLL